MSHRVLPSLYSNVLNNLMFCALRETIYGRNCFRVGFCVQWIRFSNVISLQNIEVVREEKEGNEFLKIYRGPVFNCCVTLKQIFRFAQKDVNATYLVPGRAEGCLTVTDAGFCLEVSHFNPQTHSKVQYRSSVSNSTRVQMLPVYIHIQEEKTAFTFGAHFVNKVQPI